MIQRKRHTFSTHFFSCCSCCTESNSSLGSFFFILVPASGSFCCLSWLQQEIRLRPTDCLSFVSFSPPPSHAFLSSSCISWKNNSIVESKKKLSSIWIFSSFFAWCRHLFLFLLLFSRRCLFLHLYSLQSFLFLLLHFMALIKALINSFMRRKQEAAKQGRSKSTERKGHKIEKRSKRQRRRLIKCLFLDACLSSRLLFIQDILLL